MYHSNAGKWCYDVDIDVRDDDYLTLLDIPYYNMIVSYRDGKYELTCMYIGPDDACDWSYNPDNADELLDIIDYEIHDIKAKSKLTKLYYSNA